MRFFGTWVERANASTSAFDLPCSSTPLQSITAATSHRLPVRSLVGRWYARGRTPNDLGAATHPVLRASREGASRESGFCERARGTRGEPDRSALITRTRLRPRPWGRRFSRPKAGERSSDAASNFVLQPGRTGGGRLLQRGYRYSRSDLHLEPFGALRSYLAFCPSGLAGGQ
jgi:hypothetical protein